MIRISDLKPFTRELVTLILCAISINALSAPVRHQLRVAVIDTGLDLSSPHAPLCPGLSKDFTGTGLIDVYGHGTHVSDTIDQYVVGQTLTRDKTYHSDRVHFVKGYSNNYCQIIIKFWDQNATEELNIQRVVLAFRYAATVKADYINISAGGPEAHNEERRAVLNALADNITIVAAAGNEGSFLTHQSVSYYPAMYDSRIVVVGSLDLDGNRSITSNWGPYVLNWEIGVAVLARSIGFKPTYMTGTSQATAIHTGKLIHKFLDVTFNGEGSNENQK